MKNVILLIFLIIMVQLVFPNGETIDSVKVVLCDDRPCLIVTTSVWSNLR